MDCDDVIVLFAHGDRRTLTDRESSALGHHLETCAGCRALAAEANDEEWRWLVRVPADSIDAPVLDLVTVDPIVFGAKTELAAGGMGRIMRAFDRRLGREVAVKEVLDHDLIARFEREVRITARLQHPAIVPIYEAGTFPDGSSFYTMPFVPGRTLNEALASATGLVDRLRLMPHVRALTDAIAYAHDRGIIHRDLKPSNVLVGEFGETIVIDWGLAKETGTAEPPSVDRPSAPAITNMGAVIGTPCYMSPEQASGLPGDAGDDVYALGAILYTVLAGSAPYWDITHDAEAIVTATRDRAPTPLSQFAPEAPEDLRAIAERAMARTRSARFASAKQLSDELARFDAGQLLLSRAYTLRELFARWVRKHKRALVLALAGLVATALFAIVLTRYRRTEVELGVQRHEGDLAALYRDVSRQAYRIDRDLLRLESALEGLVAAAAGALGGPEPPPAEAAFYFDTDFADPPRRPADYTTQTAYRWPVSVEFPVVGVAPNTDRQAMLPKLRRLAPLRHHIRTMVLEAAVGDITKLSAEERTARLLARASPIDYAYVDLPDGAHVVWPGIASLRHDYDVRNASFYQLSDHKRGTRWGAPYVDSTTDVAGDDLVLPCTKGIWSDSGEFLGVAGVEMTVTKMVGTSMTMTTRSVLRASLVDSQGRKVIDSRDADKRFVASGRDEAIAFTDFDLPDVAAAIRAGHEGILETARDRHTIVAAFVRLDAIGWYYVVEVDARSLGSEHVP